MRADPTTTVITGHVVAMQRVADRVSYRSPHALLTPGVTAIVSAVGTVICIQTELIPCWKSLGTKSYVPGSVRACMQQACHGHSYVQLWRG